MKKALTIVCIALTTFIVTVACKSAVLGPKYPVDDLSEYDVVVIATVDHAVHSTEGYQGLETFDLTIGRCLKGDLRVGEKISGKAKVEEARAVCPVRLSEGEDHLLLLTRSVQGYRLSRFSFPVKKGYVYFDDYILQIEKILSSGKDQ